jgi:P3 major capsid protein
MPPQTQGNTAAQSAAMQAQNTQGVNDQISAYIRSVSSEVTQQIYSTTLALPAAGNNVINLPLKNVGLVKGFWVELNATMSNTGSGAASLTNWNAANLLSNISYFDLDNYQRINCAGWFMNMIGTAKEGFPFGAAVLSSAMDTPIVYGNNFNVISATASLAATSGSGTVRMKYWVPLAYSKSDLRGSVFMGVVNATSYLQLTINPTPGVASGDPTLAIYTGANTAVTISSIGVVVYQVYLDQLPRYPQGSPQAGSPILPPIDISTQYRLITTSLTGVTVGQDFPIPFSNFQQFLSLGLIYDQAGTLNGGTDINYFSLQAANTYTLFKTGPFNQALKQRIRIMTDFPLGSYLFDFRSQPISTNQTGNMQLILNAITAATGTNALAGFESFALVNTVLGAASLPAS